MKVGSYLELNQSSSIFEIDKALLVEGLNDIGDYFILINNGEVVYIVDKVCDHAGGRLIKRGNYAVCPMHEWRLNLETLKYDNGFCSKNSLKFLDKDNKIVVDRSSLVLENMMTHAEEERIVKFRFLNHATIAISMDEFTIVTDPWLFGSAFLDGWWLKSPSTKDSIEILRNSNAILISHNHPDHLNLATLSIIRKDHLILVPNFASKSTEKYLKSYGFTNVLAIDFKLQFELIDDFKISFLKSGDFRDDSGFYLSVNGQEFLLTVDANFLNSHFLPKNIDVLFTSFASGASGFPLCFENYTDDEKQRIMGRNKSAMFNAVSTYMEKTEARYYMPYAGMFEESAERDIYIKINNQKNSIEAVKNFSINRKVNFLYPDPSVEYIFSGSEIVQKLVEVESLPKDDINFLLGEVEVKFNELTFGEVKRYFESCGFIDSQHLYLVLTNPGFEPTGTVYFIDFSTQRVDLLDFKDVSYEDETCSVMVVRVREVALTRVIREMLPWEDLSIGFQIRIKRNPNVYEAKFWYHFTNVYIRPEHFRYGHYCGSCSLIDQDPRLV